jgi:hypothetical protein
VHSADAVQISKKGMQKQILKCEWLQGWELRGKAQLHFNLRVSKKMY